jgi:hypothetical protein
MYTFDSPVATLHGGYTAASATLQCAQDQLVDCNFVLRKLRGLYRWREPTTTTHFLTLSCVAASAFLYLSYHAVAACVVVAAFTERWWGSDATTAAWLCELCKSMHLLFEFCFRI